MNSTFKTCAENGDIELVKSLLQEGVNIHIENNYALRWSSSNGHLEVVRYLVEQGADIHANNEYALRHAALNGYLEVVDYLIENGANIYNAINYYRSYNTLYDLLKKYIKKEMYKGPTNDQTELDCAICLTEMNNGNGQLKLTIPSENQEIIQCKTCKKCVHNECHDKWNKNCVYCRN
jgi:ankyrin repeat protein